MDAELYAILAFLQRVHDESEEVGSERVLVVSDCQAALKAIEAVWREGGHYRSRDRAGMLEAISKIRMRLGKVVFLWCPGHRGVSGNEYADMVAAAYAERPDDIEAAAVELVVVANVTSKGCMYENASEYDLDNWSLVDRRCFRLMRWHMAKWVREELAKNVSTLLYDRALMDKNKNYGEGGMCSEILCAGVRCTKKLKPIDGLEQMHEDAMLVGMTMGARAGDTRLPHDAPFMRCLQTEMAAASGHTGPHVREARKGCPACRRPPGNVCLECSGWRYRPMGAAPACSNAACPGYVYQEWTRVPGGRGGRGASLVTFAVPTESFRRQARRDAAARQGGRVHVTCAERLRALRLLREEDDILPDYEAPLADLRHVLIECKGVSDAMARRIELKNAVMEIIASVRQVAEDGAENCIVALEKAVALLEEGGTDTESHGSGLAQGWSDELANEGGGWTVFRKLLGWIIPDIRSQTTGEIPLMMKDRKKRKDRLAEVEKCIRKLATLASQMTCEWRAAYRWEVHRRRAAEQSRSILRIILRAWREQTDERRARLSTRSLESSSGKEPLAPQEVPAERIPWHGTWIQMFKTSLRLVQHDVIVRNMRGKHDRARFANRMRIAQRTREKESGEIMSDRLAGVTSSLRSGNMWERPKDPG